MLAANTATRLAVVVLTDLAAAATARGITRSTACLAASADGGAGTARPERAHQVPMAALSAALWMRVSAPPASMDEGVGAPGVDAGGQKRELCAGLEAGPLEGLPRRQYDGVRHERAGDHAGAAATSMQTVAAAKPPPQPLPRDPATSARSLLGLPPFPPDRSDQAVGNRRPRQVG